MHVEHADVINPSGYSNENVNSTSGGFRQVANEGNWLVNSFSTRRLSSCTNEYAHMYNISTYSV